MTGIRFGKYTLVGTMGTAVQLCAVALLSRLIPSHSLLATAAGLELSLLHNFVWHCRFTWSDRGISRRRQLVRFHAGNGVVAMAGNVVVVALCLRFGLPVVAANLTAIAACAGINYWIGDRWVFATAKKNF